MNGGFFEIDSKYRLSPSGLLVVDSQLLSLYRKSAGSGVVFVKNNVLGIDWSKNFINPTGIFSAVQSNPLVVDPGGKNGIFKNDFNRLNRTAICLTPDRVVLIVVEGGMSLFELGSILSSSPSQGGFGCERALNLDGGPSTQASFMLNSQSQEIEGLWKIQNALVVSANGN